MRLTFCRFCCECTATLAQMRCVSTAIDRTQSVWTPSLTITTIMLTARSTSTNLQPSIATYKPALETRLGFGCLSLHAARLGATRLLDGVAQLLCVRCCIK